MYNVLPFFQKLQKEIESKRKNPFLFLQKPTIFQYQFALEYHLKRIVSYFANTCHYFLIFLLPLISIFVKLNKIKTFIVYHKSGICQKKLKDGLHGNSDHISTMNWEMLKQPSILQYVMNFIFSLLLNHMVHSIFNLLVHIFIEPSHNWLT